MKEHGEFKAVGFPEDVGEFYRLEDTAAIAGLHTVAIPPIHRMGGVHPFSMLDYTIDTTGNLFL